MSRVRKLVVMNLLRITGTETRDDIAEAITALRAKLARAHDADVRAEIQADCDELLDLWRSTAAGAEAG